MDKFTVAIIYAKKKKSFPEMPSLISSSAKAVSVHFQRNG